MRVTLLKRHQVQTLLAAGHGQIQVAHLAGVSVRSVRRIAGEPAVEHVDDREERTQRGIGRPSEVAAFQQVDEETHAPLKSVEILRRARLDGYQGGKSAIYELIAELRPHATTMMLRFEGPPGEFSQHDFGEVRISYLDGSREVVRFFCSRLKWSRWAAVDLVPNQVAETLIRTQGRRLEMGGRLTGVSGGLKEREREQIATRLGTAGHESARWSRPGRRYGRLMNDSSRPPLPVSATSLLRYSVVAEAEAPTTPICTAASWCAPCTRSPTIMSSRPTVGCGKRRAAAQPVGSRWRAMCSTVGCGFSTRGA